MGLADEVLAGGRRALARLVTHVENDDEVGRDGLRKLYPHTGKAQVVGLTGPPGAGKSSLIDALIAEFGARRVTVGVVAIDPSSPLSGGATLGDRIRMLERQANPGVFIRSMASRGRHGGLAPATAGVVHVLDAAGFDAIVVETVGVGQADIDIARLVDTVVLVQVPASGDSVQLLKAGILEFADIFVVNKSDLAGSEDVARGLRSMLGLSANEQGGWTPFVLRCSATTGEGIPALANAIADHFAFLKSGDRLHRRRLEVAQAEITDQVNSAIAQRFSVSASKGGSAQKLVDEVARRRLTPGEAARQLLEGWSDPRARRD